MAGRPLPNNPFSQMKENHVAKSDMSYEVLKEVLASECTDTEGNLNSFGKFHFAKGIKILASRAEVKIILEKGPIVKATWL
jgi:hypothetical protein